MNGWIFLKKILMSMAPPWPREILSPDTGSIPVRLHDYWMAWSSRSEANFHILVGVSDPSVLCPCPRPPQGPLIEESARHKISQDAMRRYRYPPEYWFLATGPGTCTVVFAETRAGVETRRYRYLVTVAHVHDNRRAVLARLLQSPLHDPHLALEIDSYSAQHWAV